MMPLRLTSPTVGLIPASPLIDEGETIEPSVSVPTATAHKLAAAAARSGAGAGRVAVERVWIARLTAASAPSAGGVPAAEVCPLAAISLAEDHGSGGAQARYHERILRRPRAHERHGAGGSLHAIGGRDVVLYQDGNAMQRPTWTLRAALAVEIVCDRLCIGIELDYGIHFVAALIDRRNAREIVLSESARGKLPAVEAASQRFECDLV